MTDDEPLRFDVNAFREVVRHPKAHAVVLGQYRIGEYAGVVAPDRLLGEARTAIERMLGTGATA